jgi:hypothetical protein
MRFMLLIWSRSAAEVDIGWAACIAMSITLDNVYVGRGEMNI